jgi:hypothetical protein
MWIMTTFGFFSIVEKPQDEASGMLTIRARVDGDLEALRDRHLPTLGPIEVDGGTDYKYRARAARGEQFSAAAVTMA